MDFDENIKKYNKLNGCTERYLGGKYEVERKIKNA